VSADKDFRTYGYNNIQNRKGLHCIKAPGLQALLKRLQDAIRKAVPDAEEVISYQMPGYKLKGGYLLFFAVWKEHFSLYPFERRSRWKFQRRTVAIQPQQRHNPVPAL
jgi:uncharacterized protein YdhG (YjbR/CyaY superfamily)